MQFSILCIIGAFTFFHLTQLAGKGRTTIEFCEENNNDDFSQGFWENLMITLGRNPLLWCFPFCVNKDGKGIDYVPKNILPVFSSKEPSQTGKDEHTVIDTGDSLTSMTHPVPEQIIDSVN